MDTENKSKRTMVLITQGIQVLMNVSLVITALILCYLMVREICLIFFLATTHTTNVHDILQEVLVFFLYFGFVSMIVKYFKEEYHFPLRYLLYIGITATIRFIIVNRDNVLQNLIMSLVVTLLLFGYLALSIVKVKKD